MANTLFPIFLKLDQLNTLVVGGGNVALEKVSAILRNSPDASVFMVATFFREDTLEYIEKFPLVSYEICNECLSQSLKVGISDYVPEVGNDRQPLSPPLCVRGSRSVGVAPIAGGSASASRFASACRCT